MISSSIRCGVWVLFFASVILMAGCGASSVARTDVVVGIIGTYNYSVSVIQSGDQQQFWWCAGADNSQNHYGDTIQYQSIDTTTHATQRPATVLTESTGTWDEAFTCNPHVIRGSFNNPLGDGKTYTYEMFYVGTASLEGINASIGAAFSNDGVTWNKYPEPVILSTQRNGYGVGQPAAYNQDGKSGIVLFYEDNANAIHHVKAVSTDGVHFTVQGSLTLAGLDPSVPNPSWADIGFDPTTKYWYATFESPVRATDTTDGVLERGQYGFSLYRIPDNALLTGSTPWQVVKTFDTNSTGYESNFLPGLLHDGYGNLNVGSYPTLEMFPAISDPPPAWNASPHEAGESGAVTNWVIGSVSWTPGEQPRALNRYANLVTYQVTTGWVDPGSDYKIDATLGHLYPTPQNGATRAFYGCKNGETDYLVSLDPNCVGSRIIGLDGYGYAQPVAGVKMVPLYSCLSLGVAHFVSRDANCETRGAGKLLGYALP